MTEGGTLVAMLAGGLALALAGASVAVVRGGAGGRMRERVRAATALEGPVAAEAAPASIRVAAPDEGRRALRRLAALLGYNPELPAGYAASVPLALALACGAGLLAFWGVGAVFGQAVGAAVGAAAVVAAARFQMARKTRLYAAALFTQIPDAVSLVLRAVRAGLPVSEAIRSISLEMPSPSRDEFARVVGETGLGVPLEAALWNLYRRVQVREYAFLAVTLGLHAQTGGNLAETLENLADMVRRRVSTAARARALAAEARASAMILACLPFVAAGAIAVISPEYLADLFTDPRGKGFLLTFVVMLSSGLLSIRWLIQRSTQD